MWLNINWGCRKVKIMEKKVYLGYEGYMSIFNILCRCEVLGSEKCSL